MYAPKPPVPAVLRACTTLSNRLIPPQRRNTTSSTVSAMYSRYRILAVSLDLGASLSTVGPGISALRMLMDRSGVFSSITTNTRMPMPPIQWVKLRQKIIPRLRASTSGRMVAPVVVKPLTVSKNAST